MIPPAPPRFCRQASPADSPKGYGEPCSVIMRNVFFTDGGLCSGREEGKGSNLSGLRPRALKRQERQRDLSGLLHESRFSTLLPPSVPSGTASSQRLRKRSSLTGKPERAVFFSPSRKKPCL